jgi:hypothetical protein
MGYSFPAYLSFDLVLILKRSFAANIRLECGRTVAVGGGGGESLKY